MVVMKNLDMHYQETTLTKMVLFWEQILQGKQYGQITKGIFPLG